MSFPRQMYEFLKAASVAHAKWDYEVSMSIIKNRKKLLILLVLLLPILAVTLLQAADMIGGKTAYAPAHYSNLIFVVSIAVGLARPDHPAREAAVAQLPPEHVAGPRVVVPRLGRVDRRVVADEHQPQTGPHIVRERAKRFGGHLARAMRTSGSERWRARGLPVAPAGSGKTRTKVRLTPRAKSKLVSGTPGSGAAALIQSPPVESSSWKSAGCGLPGLVREHRQRHPDLRAVCFDPVDANLLGVAAVSLAGGDLRFAIDRAKDGRQAIEREHRADNDAQHRPEDDTAGPAARVFGGGLDAAALRGGHGGERRAERGEERVHAGGGMTVASPSTTSLPSWLVTVVLNFAHLRASSFSVHSTRAVMVSPMKTGARNWRFCAT